MPITGIHHVTLTTLANVEARLRAFYGELLGLREIAAPDITPAPLLAYETGNVPLYIFTEADRPGGAQQVAFAVNDLAATRAKLNANGYPTTEHTAHHLTCQDPAGNGVALVELPAPAVAEARKIGPITAVEFALDSSHAIANGQIERLSFSPDGVWVAAGTATRETHPLDEPRVYVWRGSVNGAPEIEIELDTSINEMQFTPDGRALVTLTEDGSLESWRVGESEGEGEFAPMDYAELQEAPSGLAFINSDGAVAVGNETTVELFQPNLDHWHTLRPAGLGYVWAVAAQMQDNLLAVGGEAMFVQLWQIRPLQKAVWEARGHTAPIMQLEFHPLEAMLAGVADDGTVWVWDLNANPETPLQLETGEAVLINVIAFSPNGQWLACGDDEGRVTVWDCHTWERLGATTSYVSPVIALTFHPENWSLIAGHEDGQIQTWQITH